MVLFFQQLATGLSIGSVYALLAVGYALVFSIFNFSNFAYGASMMVAAYAGYYAVLLLKLPFWAMFIVAMLIGTLSSVVIERIAYRPLRVKNSPKLFLMITAIGVNLFLTQLVVVVLGGEYRGMPNAKSLGTISFGEVKVGVTDALAAVVSVTCLMLLWYFLERTKLGIAVRACSYDMNTAQLMGIPVDTVAFLIFSLAGIMASIAGVFFSYKYAVYPALGGISNKAFIASVLGGLGSLPGAVVGGVILGVLETLISGYISSIYRDIFSFSVLVLTLVFMPKGLFGKHISESL